MTVTVSTLTTNVQISASRDENTELLPWIGKHLRLWVAAMNTEDGNDVHVKLVHDEKTATSVANNYAGFTLYLHRPEKATPGADPIPGNYGLHFYMNAPAGNNLVWHTFRDHVPSTSNNGYGTWTTTGTVTYNSWSTTSTTPRSSYILAYNPDAGNRYFYVWSTFNGTIGIGQILRPAAAGLSADYPPVANGFGWYWHTGGSNFGAMYGIGRDHSSNQPFTPLFDWAGIRPPAPYDPGFSIGNVPIPGRNGPLGYAPPGIRLTSDWMNAVFGGSTRVNGKTYTQARWYTLVQTSDS